jgi:hypothetical protein
MMSLSVVRPALEWIQSLYPKEFDKIEKARSWLGRYGCTAHQQAGDWPGRVHWVVVVQWSSPPRAVWFPFLPPPSHSLPFPS